MSHNGKTSLKLVHTSKLPDLFILLTVICSLATHTHTHTAHCCVYIATVVTRTRLDVPLQVICLSCLLIQPREVIERKRLRKLGTSH